MDEEAAGLGKQDELNADALRTAAAAVARLATFGGTIGWLLDDSLPLDLSEQARAVVDGVVLGSYDPGQWKSERPERRELDYVRLIGASTDAAKEVKIFGLNGFLIERYRQLSEAMQAENRQLAVRRAGWGGALAALGYELATESGKAIRRRQRGDTRKAG